MRGYTDLYNLTCLSASRHFKLQSGLNRLPRPSSGKRELREAMQAAVWAACVMVMHARCPARRGDRRGGFHKGWQSF
jgi:hypothetical protein